MIRIRKISKRNLPIVITSAALAALILAYVIISAVISATSGGGGGGAEPPEIIESIGESYSGTTKLAYPAFSNGEVEGLLVDSHKGAFDMYRSEDKQYFYFRYEDENGDMQLYMPDIVGAESEFDYTDLYATESDTGLNIYKLTYLLASVTSLSFDQRIALSSDEVERQKQLNLYGLGTDEKESIIVLSTDSEGKNTEHLIEIGDTLLAGVGYYFRVDGRDYVYTCNIDTFKYALGGFEAFLHSRVVAEGLEMDNAFEPYLTKDYQQWKNTVFSYDKEASVQAVVAANSKVVVTATAKSPIYNEDNIDGDKSESDGYYKSKDIGIEFDLASFNALPRYNRLTSALVGRELGDYSDSRFLTTVVFDSLEVEFGDGDSAAYTYTVLAVESILTANGEYAEAGKSANDYTDAEMIRISYNYSIDGTAKNTVLRHAVVSLSDSAISAADRAALSAAKIGEEQNIVFSVNYDKATARQRGVKYVITDISLIYNVGENDALELATKVGETSIVTYRYCLMEGDRVVSATDSATVDMSKLTEGNGKKIHDLLLGKSAGKVEEGVAFEQISYLQSVMDFVTYDIKSVDLFVTKEKIVSFSFVNASNRDSFYGESLFVNTLPSASPYRNYALNASSCEKVVRYLGGINDDGSTDSSLGLMGTETVAVGLTPDIMKRYGLYANSIYFELPRGIQVETGADEDEVDDYESLSDLGFNIYVSDYNEEDGCRYAASDMYDVVVRIEDDGFDFLDMSFVDFWARRSLVMVSYTDIERVSLDLYMSDVYGSYTFDTQCDTIWISGGKHYTEPVDGGTEYDFLTVNVSKNGATSGNKLSQYLDADSLESIDLADVYNKVAEEKTGIEQWLPIGHDTAGASYFKELLFVIYNTYYTGALSAEEQAAAKTGPKLMSLSFTVDGSERDTYTYDFYRLDDRRIMVSLYNPGYSNEVSDFYVSTFAFKKIVSNFQRLMNGEEILPDVGYNS